MTDIIAGNTDPAVNRPWSKRKIIASGGKRRPAAFKTGTTDQTKDLAAFGYLAAPADPTAQHLVTGAWLGNSDSTPATVYSLDSAGGLWQPRADHHRCAYGRTSWRLYHAHHQRILLAWHRSNDVVQYDAPPRN